MTVKGKIFLVGCIATTSLLFSVAALVKREKEWQKTMEIYEMVDQLRVDVHFDNIINGQRKDKP